MLEHTNTFKDDFWILHVHSKKFEIAEVYLVMCLITIVGALSSGKKIAIFCPHVVYKA